MNIGSRSHEDLEPALKPNDLIKPCSNEKGTQIAEKGATKCERADAEYSHSESKVEWSQARERERRSQVCSNAPGTQMQPYREVDHGKGRQSRSRPCAFPVFWILTPW